MGDAAQTKDKFSMLNAIRFKAALKPLTLAVALAAGTMLSSAAGAQDQPATPVAPAAPAATAAPVPPPETVVATVNGRPITQADLQFGMEDYAEELGRVPEGARRGIVLDVLIDMQVLAEAAEKDGLTKSDAFKQRLAFLTAQAERNAFVEDKIAASVTDADIKARYDAELAKFAPPEEVHARHILVETEDEAKAIIADLEKGGDFEAIAKEKSKDPGSAAQGGDLGFFSKGQMVPPFEEAAFNLEVGQFTKTPVKSDFGFHVIRLEEKRKQPAPSFDEVKDRMKDLLMREKFAAALTELKQAAKVEILDESLKAQPQQAPPVPLPGGNAPAAPAQPAQ